MFSLQFEDQKFKLTNDGLDDNPCLPDIVRGTDPGWALLTYDEYYDRNPDLQQYTALYKNVVVPAALPPIVPPAPPPAPGPPPPRRLRRGTRADWDEVVVIDTDEETCINGGMGRLREMEDDYQEFRRQQGGVEDPSVVMGSPDVVPTDVPVGEGAGWPLPGAETGQSASPELPAPTGA